MANARTVASDARASLRRSLVAVASAAASRSDRHAASAASRWVSQTRRHGQFYGPARVVPGKQVNWGADLEAVTPGDVCECAQDGGIQRSQRCSVQGGVEPFHDVRIVAAGEALEQPRGERGAGREDREKRLGRRVADAGARACLAPGESRERQAQGGVGGLADA